MQNRRWLSRGEGEFSRENMYTTSSDHLRRTLVVHTIPSASLSVPPTLLLGARMNSLMHALSHLDCAGVEGGSSAEGLIKIMVGVAGGNL